MRDIWEGYVATQGSTIRGRVVVEADSIEVRIAFGNTLSVPGYRDMEAIKDEALRRSMARAGYASTMAAAASQALKAGKDPAEVCAMLIRACVDGPSSA